MALIPIGPKIESQPLNDNFAWLQSLSAGNTPRGVKDTLAQLQAAYPTGTNGVWITLDNGYWNFWNGTAWTPGGVYQATLIGVDQIKSWMIDGSITNVFDYTNPNNLDNKVVLYSTGNIVTNTSYIVTDYIPIIANMSITASIVASETCAYYDVNKNHIGGHTIPTTTTGPYTFTVIDNPNIRYMRFNVNKILVAPNVFQITTNSEKVLYWLRVTGDNIEDFSITGNHYNDRMQMDNLFNYLDTSILKNNVISWNGSNVVIGSNNNWTVSHFIRVFPNEYVTANALGASLCVFYNSSKTAIGGLNIGGSQHYPGTFQIPSDSDIMYMKINISNTDPSYELAVVVYGGSYPQNFISFNNDLYGLRNFRLSDINMTSASVLNHNMSRQQNKKILVTGDSITELDYHTTTPWHEFLKTWLKWNSVQNDGKSGTGLIRPFGGNVGIFTRIDTWDATYGTAWESLMVMGNMNDSNLFLTNDLPLGSFSDSPYPATQTQYSILHATIQKLLTKYPNKPIVWITSTPRRTNYQGGPGWGKNNTWEPYNNAIVEVCAHYSIPCLDLYHSSSLRPWLDDFNDEFFSMADGTHPNIKGHELMAQKILDFVSQFN